MKKALAFIVMFAAIVPLLIGTSYVNGYSSQETRQDVVSTNSAVLAADGGYGHIFIRLNETEEHYAMSIKVSNGSVRECVANEGTYQAWLNGSYKPQWREVPDQASPGRSYEGYFPLGANPPAALHYILWNPDSSVSKEVTINIAIERTETVYNMFNLEVGVALVVLGVVSGLAAAYTLGKRMVFAVVALSMAVTGAFLVLTNTQSVYHEGTVATKQLTLPAAANLTEPIRYNASGAYALFLKIDNGTANTTVITEANYAAFSAGQYEPSWRSGQHSFGFTGRLPDESISMVYLIVSNPDNFSKQVTVDVFRGWQEYNYVCLVGGALLAMFGIAAFYLAIRPSLASFNRALENQQ